MHNMHKTTLFRILNMRKSEIRRLTVFLASLEVLKLENTIKNKGADNVIWILTLKSIYFGTITQKFYIFIADNGVARGTVLEVITLPEKGPIQALELSVRFDNLSLCAIIFSQKSHLKVKNVKSSQKLEPCLTCKF